MGERGWDKWRETGVRVKGGRWGRVKGWRMGKG